MTAERRREREGAGGIVEGEGGGRRKEGMGYNK